MGQPTRHVEAPEETLEKTLGRRELLKALAAAGGAVTASSLLPGEWAKPVVEVGVLPAHAQVSEGAPGNLALIIGCFAFKGPNEDVDPNAIYRDSILSTYCEIDPSVSGITLRRTITRNDTVPAVVVSTDTGDTIAGTFTSPDFDFSTLNPVLAIGPNVVTVLWEFVHSGDGTGTCSRGIEIVARPI